MAAELDRREGPIPKGHFIQRAAERIPALNGRVAQHGRPAATTTDGTRQRRAEAWRAVDVYRFHSRVPIVGGRNVMGTAILHLGHRRSTARAVQWHGELTVSSAHV